MTPTATPEQPLLLTVEMAKRLAPPLSLARIRKACKDGEIEAKWDGKRWLFLRADFTVWLHAMTRAR